MVQERETECVARALATLDGKNPDAMLPTGRMIPLPAQGNIVSRTEAEMAPVWHAYRAEANRFVVAFKALRNQD